MEGTPMFSSNLFADLTVFLSPHVMQVYVVLMILAVAAGTLFDMYHKRSFEFFVQQSREKKLRATRQLGRSESTLLAIKTLLYEVATSGEFCNPRRRMSHLLLFYGFVLYLLSTIVMVFGYSTPDLLTPAIWPILWNLGALMVLGGGSWFFFFIRVDVAKEGHSPLRLMRADLFIVSLLLSVLFALIWEIVQLGGNLAATKIFFGIYILFTTVLFLGVPWSKLAHMFYKPAAAFQRRVEEADGSSDLPMPNDGHHDTR